MCRLELEHLTTDSNELFMFENHMLTQLSGEFTRGRITKVEDPNGGEPRSVILFARSGHSLPEFLDEKSGSGQQ
jgi:hypothetical protein